MKLPKIIDRDIKGKRVLVRADLDVPFDFAQGKPEIDDTRLKNLVPTFQFLLENQAKMIIIGHLGRPGGTIRGELSLAPVCERLGKIIGKEVKFIYDITGLEAEREVSSLAPGEIVMLENLRFDSREEKNDSEFTKRMASFGQFYINECFADSHREHASIVGIPKFLPHGMGFHFITEVENLGGILENPKHPVVIIIGGAKADKVKYIDKLLDHADWVLVGGLLPRMVESYCREDGKICVSAAHLVPSGRDIDEASTANFSAIISQAGTIVWNGPMGEYENPQFRGGTEVVGLAVADSGAFKVVSGGDTVAVLQNLGFLPKMNWVSSGGGAMLEFLAEGTLPGIEALNGTEVLHT